MRSLIRNKGADGSGLLPRLARDGRVDVRRFLGRTAKPGTASKVDGCPLRPSSSR